MNYITSHHFNARIQQRSIKDFVLNSLLIYGKSKPALNGCESIYFDKRSLSEIRELDSDLYKRIERYKNSYLIISGDGILVTAARIH